MPEADRQRPSSSAGDYLKAIWELAGDGTASTKAIADRLGVRPASVTNMLGRLREMELVEYERYRGAALTGKGHAEALRLVRRHRLIETFLSERLGCPWQRVHEETERLEHGILDGFAERLAEHLDQPARDPYGAPIPAADGSLAPERDRPLWQTEEGQRVVVSRVADGSVPTLRYLWERGLVPRRRLTVKEARTIDWVVTVEDEEGNLHSLGWPASSSVFVQLLPEGYGRSASERVETDSPITPGTNEVLGP